MAPACPDAHKLPATPHEHKQWDLAAEGPKDPIEILKHAPETEGVRFQPHVVVVSNVCLGHAADLVHHLEEDRQHQTEFLGQRTSRPGHGQQVHLQPSVWRSDEADLVGVAHSMKSQETTFFKMTRADGRK